MTGYGRRFVPDEATAFLLCGGPPMLPPFRRGDGMFLPLCVSTGEGQVGGQPMKEWTMQDTWEALQQAAERELAEAADAPALEAWRIEYLGRRGRLAQAMRGLGQLPPEARPAAGAAGNTVKAALTGAFDARKQALAEAEQAPAEEPAAFDVTLPRCSAAHGSGARHQPG